MAHCAETNDPRRSNPAGELMTSVNEFNKKLVEELRKESVFRVHWSAELENFLPENFTLEYCPTETIGFFKKDLYVSLAPVSLEAPFDGTRCSCTLTITASRGSDPTAVPEIDFDRIMHVDDQTTGEIQAANVKARIYGGDRRLLASFSKILWSKTPARVEGEPEFIRKLLAR